MADLKKAILMNEKDNVATALSEIKKEESVVIVHNNKVVAEIEAIEDIELYHKLAIRPIAEGDIVYKYGEIIGKATEAIKVGEHVHVNNIESVMTK